MLEELAEGGLGLEEQVVAPSSRRNIRSTQELRENELVKKYYLGV